MIKIGDIVEGKVSMNISGSAYLVSEDLPKDIYLHKSKTNTAMHLDIVKVKIIEGVGRNIEGEVISIEKRYKTEFVGVLQLTKKHAFFIPDATKLPIDFYIPLDKLNGATHGQKVVVSLIGWKADSKNPDGAVVRIIGEAGEHETEIHAILEEYGLPYSFEEEILLEAEAISTEITEEEIAKRRDMRDVITFTIDPKDAKDFDDAISVEWVNGELFLGVHIADVSHYLTQETELDKEAYNRGTSVYLVDRCIPMLPEKLSNGLCSLRPLEDKLCFSAVFKLDHNGTVLEEWFGKTIINSDHRFTYEDAQEIIEAEKGSMSIIYRPSSSGPSGGYYEKHIQNVNKCYQAVRDLNKLAKKMRRARLADKSISFDKQEIKFDLDENNKPVGIILKVGKDSNKLIEEFMLLANKRVAKFINDKGFPMVNRGHDKPNEVKLEQLKEFVKQFGYEIKTGSPTEITRSLNKLLTDVKGTTEASMIETLVVRTMQKAIYTTKNIGHYGLGFPDYCHFTSPIRRYPDVIVHRLLSIYLNGKSKPKLEKIETKCLYLSGREKAAQKAERDSTKYMQCVYMSDKIGKVYKAIITSVADFGIFVEIGESKCDALIKLSNIKGTWEADTNNYCIKEYNTGEQLRIGDEINIVISSVDIEKRNIDASIIRL